MGLDMVQQQYARVLRRPKLERTRVVFFAVAIAS